MKKNEPTGSSSAKNFQRALANLKRSLSTPVLEPRDQSGIIKDFEMTYELAWKSLKKLLLHEGHATQGARDVFSKAYQLGYIHDENIWLEMISDRNRTAHVYDESDAKEIILHVHRKYLPLFEGLTEQLEKKR